MALDGLEKGHTDVKSVKNHFQEHISLNCIKLYTAMTKRFLAMCVKKGFVLKVFLARHKLVHRNTEKYECDQCEKSFAHKGYLNTQKVCLPQN